MNEVLEVVMPVLFIIGIPIVIFWFMNVFDEYFDGENNLVLNWKKFYALYSIAPDNYEKGSLMFVTYRSDFQSFFIYFRNPITWLRVCWLFRRKKRIECIKRDNQIKREFLTLVQKDIDQYKEDYPDEYVKHS